MPGEQRREQILDAALELINSGGIEAVTVEAVAKAIDVTRPVVYSQFTDADHILRDLLTREGDQALAQIVAGFPRDWSDVEPAAAFTDMTRAFLEAVLTSPSRWRSILLPAHGGSPPAWQKFKKRSEAMVLERLRETLGALLDGCAQEMDVELAAHTLLRSWEEAGRLVLAEPEVYPVERLTAFAGSLFSTLCLSSQDTQQSAKPAQAL